MSGLGAEPHAASRVVAFAGLATSRRGGFSSRVLALTTRVRVATWLRVLPPLCERNEQYDLRLRRHVNVECGVAARWIAMLAVTCTIIKPWNFQAK